MEEETGGEGELVRKESEPEAGHRAEGRHVDFREPHEEDDHRSIPKGNEIIPSHFHSEAKKHFPKRDIRTLNYAFGKPKIDEAAQEAQQWLDGLSIAEEEENNNPKRHIFPHGLKYRSALANLSPQMLDRLQRCEQNQEPCDPPKNPSKWSGERNASLDIHAGLHEDDHCNRPNNVWKGRRSAAGNTSTSVYAILHPQAETRYKRKKSPKKKQTLKRNYLRDHLAAIAEMSSLTHNYKEKERQQEAERQSATKHWGGREILKAVQKRQHTRVSINYVEKNMENITEQSACVRALREDSKRDMLVAGKENLGRVPEYLLRIKTELAQEAEHKAIAEAAKSIPSGRRLMSEVSRRDILQKLENKHKELIAALKSFPLICDTPRQILLRSKIEQQLRNIEASYSYYDNPKVYTSCLDTNCPTCMCLNDHFFRDSQTKLSASHGDDLFDHMACAAGIKRSPKRNRNRELDGNRGILGATSLTNKRRSQEGEIFTSPSKRQNTSPNKLFRQSHNSNPRSTWAMCEKCFTTARRQL